MSHVPCVNEPPPSNHRPRPDEDGPVGDDLDKRTITRPPEIWEQQVPEEQHEGGDCRQHAERIRTGRFQVSYLLGVHRPEVFLHLDAIHGRTADAALPGDRLQRSRIGLRSSMGVPSCPRRYDPHGSNEPDDDGGVP